MENRCLLFQLPCQFLSSNIFFLIYILKEKFSINDDQIYR
jgi:hypothetical protein